MGPDGKRADGAANALKLSIETPPPQYSYSIRSTVTIPSGKWILAGALRNPDAAAAEKYLLLFVTGEPVNTAAKTDVTAPAAKSKASGKEVTLRLFDIRDLSTGTTDFPAPTIDLATQRNPFFSARPFICSLGSDLACSIKERLLATEFADPVYTIDCTHGHLAVMQREEVQEKIAEILDGMRKVQHPQVAVKTLLVALQEVPAETYFNEDALTRVIGTREIAACPRLVCQNRQRANISGLRALSYPASA